MSVRVRLSPRVAGGNAEWVSIDDARTALASWLYARHEGGALLLYAPDPAAAVAIAEALRWMGLDWDGEPVIRSERLAPHDRLVDVADVVDDHEMAITHVIWSHERRSQAAAQLRLHEARGWTPPQFVYLPPVIWPTGDPLGSASTPLKALRARGYLAPAVVNHLARLGWSPRGKRALLSLSALAQRYDLCRLSRKPVTFCQGQLDWFNRRCLGGLDEAALARLFVPYWRDAYGLAHRAEGTALAPGEWQRTLAVSVRDEVCALPEVVDRVRFAFVDHIPPSARSAPAAQILAEAYTPEVLSAFADAIAGVEPFDFESIDALVSALRWRFKASHGIRSRDVMHVIRAALTGRLDGPCLVDACRVLGRRRCVERARHVLAEVGHA